MKAVKFMAVAAMLGMMFPVASVASSKSANQEKRKVTVEDNVELAGKTLKPGEYEVQWQGNGPAVQVNFVQHGKTVLTAPARVAQLKSPAPYDAVLEDTHTNGTKTLQEIEWNHQREALRFGAAQHGRRRTS